MTITTNMLTRAAGLSAVAAGLLFIVVQVNHPHLDAAFITTTEYTVRQSMKVLMASVSLVGITGMYLRQVKQTGLLGLIGYVSMLSTEVIGLVVIPSLVDTAPTYVNDVLAVATGGTATGDIGAMQTLSQIGGITFVAGGFLFGIALLRAGVLARWAAALLTVGTVATVTRAVLPQVNFRLFAIPIGVALVGLGYSLWRDQRSTAAGTLPSRGNAQLDTVEAK
jgi:hypothetical protein